MSDRNRDRRSYAIGAALSALLTVIAFATIPMGLPRSTALVVIAIAGLVQAIVQLRCFLHIDLTRQKREDLQLILFSLLLLTIMGGGTVWILTNLAKRMM